MKRRPGRRLGDASGNVAVLFALVTPIIVGMMALVVDVGIAKSEKNRLQSVAEASAIAAAMGYANGGEDAARGQAKAYAHLNHGDVDRLVTDTDVEFGEWKDRAFEPGMPGVPVNAVRVTATRTTAKDNDLKAFLAPMFGLTSWNLAGSAVALLDGDPLCILVLNPSRDDAFDIDPGARIDAPDCVVHVNSRNRGALEIGSNAFVNVRSISVVGGYDRRSSVTVRPTPQIGVRPMEDPYAKLVPPTNTRCGGTESIKGANTVITASLAFCGGLSIEDAHVTFSPGIYVLKDRFELKSGASVSGDGVMIYLEGSGTDFFFHSDTSFDLRAPTVGPYAGVVLWSDKRNTRDHDIYSKFGAHAEGTIYAPSSQVEFENDVVWDTPCIRLVVDRLELDNRSRYASHDVRKKCRNNILTAGVRIVR